MALAAETIRKLTATHAAAVAFCDERDALNARVAALEAEVAELRAKVAVHEVHVWWLGSNAWNHFLGWLASPSGALTMRQQMAGKPLGTGDEP